MTAVSVALVRYGHLSLIPGEPDEPDIYAHVWREGWRACWSITAGRNGVTLTHGTTWTRGGALVQANAAAQHPGLSAQISRRGGAR